MSDNETTTTTSNGTQSFSHTATEQTKAFLRANEDQYFVPHDKAAREAEMEAVFSSVGSKRRQPFVLPHQPVAVTATSAKKLLDDHATSSALAASAKAIPFNVQFESPEHQYIGDSVYLLDPNTGNQVKAGDFPNLVMANGIRLTYGQVVYLAGDFYSTPDLTPISSTPTGQQAQAFTGAVGTLVNADFTELNTIIGLVNQEYAETKNAQYPEDVFKAKGDWYNWQFNTATGGTGTESTYFLPGNWGRYMKIAAVNMDHFGQDAITCYRVGHALACSYAAAANQAKNAGNQQQYVSFLLQAYIFDGFACHFLTDIFSSGHMRTPRRALWEYDGQGNISVGSACSLFMHNEDCANGLNVVSQDGQTRWQAFGDDYFWTTTNLTNAQRCIAATQASVNDLINIAQNGGPPVFTAVAYTPNLAASFPLPPPQTNTSPLFIPTQWYNYVGTRSDLNKSTDYNWSTWTAEAKMVYNLGYLKAAYVPDPPFPHPAAVPSLPVTLNADGAKNGTKNGAKNGNKKVKSGKNKAAPASDGPKDRKKQRV